MTHTRNSLLVRRLSANPIIHPHLDERTGENINGPSLIAVPDWIEDRLGRYYLYFAHHDGDYIRLAFSDSVEGPWTLFRDGVLPLRESYFAGHVASPDAHVDFDRRQIRLYYHGSDSASEDDAPQTTRIAVSDDGLHFRACEEALGPAYFRVFKWRDFHYALAMPGVFLRSEDGLCNFTQGPTLFTPNMRHAALKLDGNTLSVYFTNARDCPERILLSTIELLPDWTHWMASEPVTVLEPELDYEGGELPLIPSVRGLSNEPVRQLRDPAIFSEWPRTYLLYSVAGERGIAIAELIGGNA